MQRTRRGLQIPEIVQAFNEIIEIIIECYNHPLRERFKNETRSTQIGKDIETALLKRGIMQRYSDIGWRVQRSLLEKDIIEPGGIKKEEEEG